MLSNFYAKIIVVTFTVESYLKAVYANRRHMFKAPAQFYFVSNIWFGYLMFEFALKPLLLREA